MDGKESEIINVTINTTRDNHKENSSVYDSNGKEKTSITSEKKEKARDSYVRMYECGKKLLHSTYRCACASHDTTKSKMKEIVEI